jgi:ESS family glutamate:Na+ symporter
MDVPVIKITVIQVLGLSAFGILLGNLIKRAIPLLERLTIPASIVGGLVYALVHLFLRDRVVNFEFDIVLRDVLMVAFFTTVGMAASLRLLKIGGKKVAIFLFASVIGLIAQMVWGASAAHAMGLPPLLGIIPGAVSLTGGPATALAFGPEFEKAGIVGATAIGLASAVFGITSSGLVGGFVGGFLVRRYKLEPLPEATPGQVEIDIDHEPGDKHGSYLDNTVALAIAMAIGSLLSMWLQKTGAVLPAYIGAMIVAGIMRNLDDVFHFAGIEQKKMDEIGNIALELFIVMALLTLQLWHLAKLAIPVLIILVGQVVITVILCWTIIFWMMGRTYPAAVMAGGYTGFMVGTVANSMACMNEIVRKYGPSPQAFFVVSIVGAFLIDFINALLINGALNLLRP